MRRGDFGRLGHGDCNDVFIPRAIDALRGRAVVRVACGDTHTLAVTEAGELYTFGRNSNGQLGHGSTDDSLAPRLVEALKVRCTRLPVEVQGPCVPRQSLVCCAALCLLWG